MALKLKQLLVGTLLLSVNLSYAAQTKIQSLTTRDLDSRDYADMRDLAFKEVKLCYQQDNRDLNSPQEIGDADEVDSSGYRQSPELRACLKDVVALILSRREQHDAVQRDLLKKTLFEVQENYRHQIILDIAREAIHRYKANSENKPYQATAYEQVKNILDNAKARLKTEREDAKTLIKIIREADLAVDSKLISYRANGPAGITANLSKKAEEILEE